MGARTALALTSVSPFLAGTDLTATAGDAANDHSVTPSGRPIVILAVNNNAASVACTIELPAVAATFNQAASIPWTIPAASGGRARVRAAVLDFEAVKQSDGTIHIDSVDANFGDVDFFAFTWTPTRP